MAEQKIPIHSITAPASAVDGDKMAVDFNAGGVIRMSSDTFISPAPVSTQVQGTTSGYTSGGLLGGNSNVIDKFPFASDTDATDVGDLTQSRERMAGASSSSHGYTSGGGTSSPFLNTIDKFPFSTDTNASDVGDLAITVRGNSGQNSTTDGYTTGGQTTPTYVDNMQKFTFSSDSNATDIGELTEARRIGTGNSSTTHGYHAGGLGPSGVPSYHLIDKFPFSTDQSSSDIAELSASVYNTGPNGQNSDSHGYVAGGYDNDPAGGVGVINIIQKYSFSVDANSTDVGDLTATIFGGTGQSSTSDGYQSGGQAPSYSNKIDKFPFSSDSNATDVANLTQARTGQAGQQV